MFHKILVIDDDFEMRSYLSMCLAETGRDCYQAEQGQEALLLLDKMEEFERPQILVVDMSMPVMDGLTFLAELEKKDYSSNMRAAIFSSALVPPVVHFHGKLCPVFFKPQEMDELLKFIPMNESELNLHPSLPRPSLTI